MRNTGLWAGLVILALFGCNKQQLRLQSEDEEKERDRTPKVKTVGDVTAIWGTDEVRLYGVGVVQGLAGQGRDPKPGEYRRMALHDLKQRGVEDPVAFLASRDSAVVIVSAALPPGVRQGDPLDVAVEVPPGDETVSLRGGTLLECELREYANGKQLRKDPTAPATLKGKVMAKAGGPLVVGLGESGDRDRLRHGRIWGGGKAFDERNFALLIDKDHQQVNLARTIAERVNEVFYGPFRGTMRGMAQAQTSGVVTLRVPTQYRHNLPRYLRVVRQIPLRESQAGKAKYCNQLREELLIPEHTIVAALKLEALGRDSVDDLKPGLNSEHPLVRFSAAEALAYLGDPACGEPLARAVREEPLFRAYSLAALASLDEAICHVELQKLLAASSSETRYGAFRALRKLTEQSKALNGEYLNSSFYLHRVASDAPPLVHITSSCRPEVVVFGEDPMLLPPFSFQAGPEFVVTARDGDDYCFVSRISTRSGQRKEKCSVRVEDIVRQLGAMGATYPDVVDLLQQAASRQSLTCRLAIDALPQATPIYRLARAGLESGKTADDAADGAIDLGSLPNLFAIPGKKAVPSEVGEGKRTAAREE